jgi:hypothetical protein
MYRDTGTAWVQIAETGASDTDTLQTVTNRGNTTTNEVTIGSATAPTAPLDVYGGGDTPDIVAKIQATSTNSAFIQFTQNGTAQFFTGNRYKGGANLYIIGNSQTPQDTVLINSSTNRIAIGGHTDTPAYLLSIGGTLQNTTSAYFSTDSGNVGIGTTSASYKLDVNGTTRIQGTELLLDNGTTGVINLFSTTPEIRFASADPTGYRIFRSATTMTWNSANIALQIQGNSAYTIDGSNGHVWRTALSGGAALARLTTGGNFMVGTTTDAGYKFDVNGTFRSNQNGYGIVLTSTSRNSIQWIDSGTFRWAIGSQAIQGGELANSFNFYSGTSSSTQVSIASDGGFMIGVPYPISSNYAPSAILQAASTTRGFLPPRMTTAQINAISSPAEGLIAFNTTISHLCVYQGGAWVRINHSPM